MKGNLQINRFMGINSPKIQIFLNNERSILLSKFLQFQVDLSIKEIEKLIRMKKIRAKASSGEYFDIFDKNQVLNEGDIVEIKKENLNSECDVEYLMHFPFDKKKIENTVLFKDDNIIAINKPGNIAIHGGSKTHNHIGKFFKNLQFESKEVPRLVHRLDRKTSGLLLLARNLDSSQKLSKIFKSSSFVHSNIPSVESFDAFGRKVDLKPSVDENVEQFTSVEIEKYYYAITTGSVQMDNKKIDNYIAYTPENYVGNLKDCQVIRNLSNVSPRNYNILKRAVTDVKVVVQDFGGGIGSLLELSPKTGRKRQLRIHCAESLECPILGDDKYGLQIKHMYRMGWDGLINLQEYRFNGAQEFPMFLHLHKIVLKNYYNGGNKDLILKAPFPKYWTQLLTKLNVNIEKLINHKI
jgi:23S rRNA-/tRNA-specific pseudouridylate synthase